MGTDCNGDSFANKWFSTDIENGIQYAKDRGFLHSTASEFKGTIPEMFTAIKKDINLNKPVILTVARYDENNKLTDGHNIVAYGYASR